MPYVNGIYSGAKAYIFGIWIDNMASKWKYDDDALKSAKLFLASCRSINSEHITLSDEARAGFGDDYVCVEFIYKKVDRSVFTSAAIDGTFNVTNTLKQLHVIVGEHEGEGYPLAALFAPVKGVTSRVITEFFHIVVVKGNRCEYVTTDHDLSNVEAISAEY